MLPLTKVLRVMLVIVLILFLSFVAIFSLIYGHVALIAWLRKRFAKTRLGSGLISASVIFASLGFPSIPSYRTNDLIHRGLLPFGISSDLFLIFILAPWYSLIFSLGLIRLSIDYYRHFKKKPGV